MGSLQQIFTITVLLVSALRCIHGRSTGLNIDASCPTLVPRHRTISQNSSSPYKISFSPSKYQPNSPIRVSLSSCTKTGFKGFLIQARRAETSTNQSESLGYFEAIQNTRQTCPDKKALIHADGTVKRSITFNWHPPATAEGHVIFSATCLPSDFAIIHVFSCDADTSWQWSNFLNRATFVRDKATFWADVKSEVLIDASDNRDVNSTSLLSPTALDEQCSSENNLDEGDSEVLPSSYVGKDSACGKSKGCFSDCTRTTCSYLLSWSEDGNYGIYTLSSRLLSTTGTWIAMALSSDDKMGDDSVLGCAIGSDGSVKLFTGINTGKEHPDLFTDNDVTLFSYETKNGVLSCTIKCPKAASADGKRFNITNAWTVLFARGVADVGSDNVILKFHNVHNCFVSRAAYKINDIVDSLATNLEFPLIKAHGSLMVGAWIFFASVGIIAARYYKPVWKKMLCAQKVWFQIHRACMVLAFLATVAGFVIIFIEVQGWSQLKESKVYLNAHPIIGVVVVGLTVLNPIMAIFRPHPGTQNRPIFNWAHWFVGSAAHVLGVITIFFGVQLGKAHAPDYLFYILVAYVAWQIFVQIMLELISCYGRRKDRREIYEMSGGDTSKVNFSTESDGSRIMKRVLFGIHIFIVAVFAVVIITLITRGKLL